MIRAVNHTMQELIHIDYCMFYSNRVLYRSYHAALYESATRTHCSGTSSQQTCTENYSKAVLRRTISLCTSLQPMLGSVSLKHLVHISPAFGRRLLRRGARDLQTPDISHGEDETVQRASVAWRGRQRHLLGDVRSRAARKDGHVQQLDIGGGGRSARQLLRRFRVPHLRPVHRPPHRL